MKWNEEKSHSPWDMPVVDLHMVAYRQTMHENRLNRIMLKSTRSVEVHSPHSLTRTHTQAGAQQK